jgi:prevent-host-death family protein
MEVDIYEAKAHLAQLLKSVAIGEEVIITEAGKPIAKLMPIQSEGSHFRLGSAGGEFTVPDDFNDPDPEIEALFYDGDIFPSKNVSDK